MIYIYILSWNRNPLIADKIWPKRVEKCTTLQEIRNRNSARGCCIQPPLRRDEISRSIPRSTRKWARSPDDDPRSQIGGKWRRKKLRYNGNQLLKLTRWGDTKQSKTLLSAFSWKLNRHWNILIILGTYGQKNSVDWSGHPVSCELDVWTLKLSHSRYMGTCGTKWTTKPLPLAWCATEEVPSSDTDRARPWDEKAFESVYCAIIRKAKAAGRLCRTSKIEWRAKVKMVGDRKCNPTTLKMNVHQTC